MRIVSVAVERTATVVLTLTESDVQYLKENMDIISDKFEGRANITITSVYNFIESIIFESEKTGLI